MTTWTKLLNQGRRKDKAHGNKSHSTANGRYEIERDYDRILFATPTRRLADKTQVFPLDKNDSVRTRLTHSLEVSAIARSIGLRLVYEYPNIFKDITDHQFLQRSVPALLAAIGLVHDMGNPPFGHQGEFSIQSWFKRNLPEQNPKLKVDTSDFLFFDGNAQTIRLLTKLQILSDNYGLNLTYATLSALIKYPVSVKEKNPQQWKKHGYFISEEEAIKEIWSETGLSVGMRHPFTYIMEACDDIAYAVMDAEDTIKKGLASFLDLANFLEHNDPNDEIIKKVLSQSRKKHEEFKKSGLSPQELNDCSMQMFRVFSITEMTKSVVDYFVKNVDSIIHNDMDLFQGIISKTNSCKLCANLKSFDKIHGFRHRSVLELELKGHNNINKLMDMLWVGIHGQLEKQHESTSPFGKYVYSRISESYRRVFEKETNLPTLYKEAQLLADAVSGMTDSYLISLHDELIPLYERRC